MRRHIAIFVCVSALATLAGCGDWRRHGSPRQSIKDDLPAPAAAAPTKVETRPRTATPPKTETPRVDAPSPREAPKAPAPKATAPTQGETPAKVDAPRPDAPKPDTPNPEAPAKRDAPRTNRDTPLRVESPPPRIEPAIDEQARREQAHLCGQRHIDHNAGELWESEDQKLTRDSQCIELHKRDYLR